MLNSIEANHEQTVVIYKKYVKYNFFLMSFVIYDEESKIYFITCSGILGTYSFQIRNGFPMFFEIRKGQTAYRISYLDKEIYTDFYNKLTKVANKAIDKWVKGNSL